MREIDVLCDKPIIIGKQDENNITVVKFPVSEWIEEFGTGEFTLLHRRPTDPDGYPINVEYADGYVEWTVKDSDLVYQGLGECQLKMNVDGKIVRSQIWKTYTARSIGGNADPPAPWQSWVNEVKNDAERAEIAADRAEGVSSHPPYPNTETQTWWIWNEETEEYEDSHISYSGSGGAVDSVNGKTGEVVLDAEDVGALPADTELFSGDYNDLRNKPTIPTVPTDVSAFVNDAEYQTATDVESAISTAISGKINKPSEEGTIGQILATNGDGTTYWKTESGGGGGGTTDFEELSNRPKYNGSIMTRNTNIPEVKTAAWNAKYDKPSGGIPKSDLATSVQASLGLADSALQSHQDISGKADASDLTDEVNRATAAEEAIAADVDDIEALIPSQATSSNQLADKAFVNSTIGTNTANYISNNGQPFTSLAQLQTYSGTVTNNDYAFVTGTDSSGNTYYDRYKATVSGSTVSWAKEYRLNNSAFTAAQWSAIESGITSAHVTKLNSIEAGAEVNVQSDWNQSDATADDFIKNKPTIPTVPTKLSDLTADSTHRTVTDTEKSTWNSKQNAISDLETIRSGAALGATAVQPEAGKGLFSGSYNDLTNKPTIPSAVTEATVSGWGFTKNSGTYSKPSGGIPKTDLATTVQTSLGKADTALQSFTETDPTVPSWAKQTSKPTYTASEIGLGNVGNFKAVSTVANQGLTSTEKSNARTNIGAGTSSFSGSYNDLTNKPTIPSVPTALSAFTDDLGSSPTHTHSQYYLASNPNGYTDNTVANSKYSKPSGGIPKTDLATAVQDSLDLADSALQTHQDISGKANTNFSNVANKAIAREKLADDALYSPIKDCGTVTEYTILAEDVGKTLKFNSTSNVSVVFPGALFDSLPNGVEFAVLKWAASSVSNKITISVNEDHYLATSGAANVKNGSAVLSSSYGMAALKKITGVTLLVTGDVD